MRKENNISVRSLAWQNRADDLFRLVLKFCALLFPLLIVAIIFELWSDASLGFARKGLLDFLSSQQWNPVTGEYGALSSIYGTLVSTVLALMLAVPVSLLAAVFLVEIAPPMVSTIAGIAIELLAAVPSIIYGMWGLFVFAPFLADHVQPWLTENFGFLPLFQGPPMGIGMLSAGLILALMILPYITAVTRDVLRMVPGVLKESAYGMGSTSWEVLRRVTIPYGARGIFGACFLGLSRALGETMAVTFVIGNSHELSLSLFAPGNTIASTLANEFSEASEPLHFSALAGLGLVLCLISIVVQSISQIWIKRAQKRMGRGL